eukprot:GHVN01027735.1.p1 GENE.GHVN01027735.1~~GHVN01027735.1.p1  ORF type:complete len:575 (-),score=72.50 GHVN01027735.1:154-1731(-)
MLASSYVGVKGGLGRFVSMAQLPYYKTYLNLGGHEYQRSLSVVVAPWAMKGLWGALSDSFPLFGYHKRYYIIIVSVLGCMAMGALAILPPQIGRDNPALPCVLMMVVHLQIALTDLLCEGKFVEKMVASATSSGDLVTFVWLCVCVGSLVPTVSLGYLVDAHMMPFVYLLFAPLSAQVILPTAMGWLQEVKVAPEDSCRFDTQKLSQQRRLFSMAIFTSAAALGLSLISAFVSSELVLFSYCIIVSLGLNLTAFMSLNTQLAKCLLFMFLQDCFYISIGGAVDYWFTASCVINGPHFSYAFYQTWAGIVGLSAGMISLLIFQKWAWRAELRFMFWGSALLKAMGSLFDVVIMMRWNVTLLGLSDKSFYLFSDGVIANIVFMLNFLPAMLLISRMCPKRMEATVYAILAGMSNFGSSVSTAFGSVAIKLSDVDTHSCQFTHIVPLVLVCHFVLPLLVIPLTFFLIPKGTINDVAEISEESEDRVTEEGEEGEALVESEEAHEDYIKFEETLHIDGMGIPPTSHSRL